MLKELPEEEVIELIQQIDFESFTETESINVMAVISAAPQEVKELFEKEINIFSDSNFGTYVPTGSVINVEQRRVLVAAGATIMSAAAPAAAGGRRK